jgi:hypothetical protein
MLLSSELHKKRLTKSGMNLHLTQNICQKMSLFATQKQHTHSPLALIEKMGLVWHCLNAF